MEESRWKETGGGRRARLSHRGEGAGLLQALAAADKKESAQHAPEASRRPEAGGTGAHIVRRTSRPLTRFAIAEPATQAKVIPGLRRVVP
jgi:hypothetical protein